MALILWSAGLNLGIDIIDQQHRRRIVVAPGRSKFPLQSMD
jgi:hypothetical protein